MEEVPVWETINSTARKLDVTIPQDFRDIMSRSHLQSTALFRDSYSPTIDHDLQRDLLQRSNYLLDISSRLLTLLKTYESSLTCLRDNLSLFFHADPSFHSRLNEMPREILRALQRSRDGPNSMEAYKFYTEFLQRGKHLLSLFNVLSLAHSLTTHDLAKFLLGVPQETSFKKLCQDQLHFSWPYVLSCLLAIDNMKKPLKKEIRELPEEVAKAERNHFASLKELMMVYSKLNHATILIFNLFNRPLPELQNNNQFREKIPLAAPFFQGTCPFELQFMTPTQLLRESFRDSLAKFYNVENVVGDGNCFFRAVIRHEFPMIPRDHEDSLSLELRGLVNSDQSINDKFKDFVEKDENDEASMRNAGVWADHIQIKKLSEYLRRPLWLVRHDDLNLSMNDTNQLIPGQDYRIGPNNEIRKREVLPPNRILLLYSPDPGHYEALLRKPTRHSGSPSAPAIRVSKMTALETAFFDFEALLARRSQSQNQSPQGQGQSQGQGQGQSSLSNPGQRADQTTPAPNPPKAPTALEAGKAILFVYFEIEREVVFLLDLLRRLFESSEAGLQNIIQREIQDNVDLLARNVKRFGKPLTEVELPGLRKALLTIPEGRLYESVLKHLDPPNKWVYQSLEKLKVIFEQQRDVCRNSPRSTPSPLQSHLSAPLSPSPIISPRQALSPIPQAQSRSQLSPRSNPNLMPSIPSSPHLPHNLRRKDGPPSLQVPPPSQQTSEFAREFYNADCS